MLNFNGWPHFEAQCQRIQGKRLADLFAHDAQRVKNLTFSAADLHIDLSKTHIDLQLIDTFVPLCQEAGYAQGVEALFSGAKINVSEQRAVLHTALRQQEDTPVCVDGVDVMPEIRQTQQKMRAWVEQIYTGQWRGCTGQAITDVVNIGIGGSDLGPRMVVEALRPYHQNKVNVHFVANMDPADLSRVLQGLTPATTLFIVASKSFTTQETLANARAARQWLLAAQQDETALSAHFIAITSAVDRAVAFGVLQENCFAMWDFVGGRYSLWSAIGLVIMLAIGSDNFTQLLQGAAAMDTHFRTTPVAENLPALLAMVGIVYGNVWQLTSHAVIPYAEDLHVLPAYLQQVEMESNGKSVNCQGMPLHYHTSPVIWGGVGSNGQHMFHQLLHQGTVTVPVDFVIPFGLQQSSNPQQTALVANGLAQAQALMSGCSHAQVVGALLAQGMSKAQAVKLAPHKVIVGNKPSTTILFEQLKPKTLGALIALYEHKIFVQSMIWQINAFDQFGVVLGKQLGQSILSVLQEGAALSDMDDDTMATIIREYRRLLSSG